MGLLNDLQTLCMEQRKAQVAKTGGEHASYLVYVRAQVLNAAKRDGNREATDADAEDAIRAELSQHGNLLKGNAMKGVESLPASDYRTLVQSRYDILQTFGVAPVLEGDELADAVRQAAADAGMAVAPGSIGPIMGKLKAAYGVSRIDGALVKAVLSGAA